MTLKAHKVIVYTEGAQHDGFGTAKDCTVDGKRMLLLSGSTVKAEVGDRDAMTATLTLLADVEFRDIGRLEADRAAGEVGPLPGAD
jgi:hypothetical protein